MSDLDPTLLDQPVSTLAFSAEINTWFKKQDIQAVGDLLSMTDVEIFKEAANPPLAKEVLAGLKDRGLANGIRWENWRNRNPEATTVLTPADRENSMTFPHTEVRPLAAVLNSLKTTVQNLSPDAVKSLAEPATANEIDILTGSLDIAIPPDLLELLGFCNGQDYDADDYVSLLPFQFDLLSVDGIISLRDMHTELASDNETGERYEISSDAEQIVDVHHFLDWIPFASIDRNTLYIDMQPGERGSVGQIIVGSGITPKYLAKDMAEFLGQYEAGLLAGWYFPQPEYSTFGSKGQVW